ncbi:hypothetical protein C0J52_25150 [Blattella germanica]|nr:hypothetical protein C0J52_25150 [Blattella germanica]
MEPSTESETHLRGEKKERWKCALQKNYPELFRSDVSIFPSYTQLRLPYPVVCRHRYVKTKDLIEKQFFKELATTEMIQSRALDGVRVHRIFSEGFRLPKPRNMPNPFTPNERRRVDKLMEDERKLK